jgi:predicted XRE-type DNA-binding protein
MKLHIRELDAYVMDLKSKLYSRCAKLVRESSMTHEQIAKAVGTSRARVSRIASMGENSLSIEVCIKIIKLIKEDENFTLIA